MFSELYQIVPPANRSCGDYMDAYIKARGGYLDQRSTDSMCLYCEYANGMEMADGFEMYWDERYVRGVPLFLPLSALPLHKQHEALECLIFLATSSEGV